MLELRYFWQVPLQLDNAKPVGALGAEPYAPLGAAVAVSLRDLSDLSTRGAPRPARPIEAAGTGIGHGGDDHARPM